MYKTLRSLHKWVGLIACLFLMVISATGWLLAIKGNVSWMRPDTADGGTISDLTEVVSVALAADAAFALGLPGLMSPKDIDRMEYRAKENVYKILSKENYHEVQVDGADGKVLSVGRRNDQLSEDIHDLSFFADWMHAWVLPWVAAGLFFLGLSGVVMYFVPVVRRWKFNSQKRDGSKSAQP